MKVLEIVESLVPAGGERFVVDLSNYLSSKHDVSLCTFRVFNNSSFYRRELSNRIQQIDYKGSRSTVSKIVQIFAIIRIIWRVKPDIVHAHLVAFNFIVIPAILFRKIKFYYTVHNLADKDTKRGLDFKIKRWIFQNKIRAITISKTCGDSFQSFFGFPSFKVIENGCRKIYPTETLNQVKEEMQSYKRSADTKIFVNIGRFMEQKNHKLLIKSFNLLCAENDAVLLIIGDYSNYPEFKKELEELLTTNRVYFLGTRSNATDYLLLADYFCLSSKWEGLPISLLEAGLCGAYPICTPVGGIPDVIINPNWGMLSEDLSVGSYVKTLKAAIETQVNRVTLKKLYEDRYLFDTCVKEYEDAFSL